MVFSCLMKEFSTSNGGQYETIGAFWDEMARRYGREKLQGLGYSWSGTTISYGIGLKMGVLPSDACCSGAVYREVTLPDDGWLPFWGRTEQLSSLYEDIYAGGILKYEIERFYENGDCEILVIRA